MNQRCEQEPSELALVGAHGPGTRRDELVVERGAGERPQEIDRALARHVERARAIEPRHRALRGDEAACRTLVPGGRELRVRAAQRFHRELHCGRRRMKLRHDPRETPQERPGRRRIVESLGEARHAGSVARVVGDGDHELISIREVKIDRLA
jgi:hypothetical protein